jgi:fructosamine-3-kinase
MDRSIAASVGDALGSRIAEASPLGGGDINEAYAVTLTDGRRVFVKCNGHAPADMFAAEAKGLAFLAEPGVIDVPEVLAVGERFLALELVEPGRKPTTFDDDLGRALAALHRASPGRFGLDHDNYIGRLPQPNARCDDWPSFYRERRLEPQLALAERGGLADAALRRSFEALYTALPELVGPAEPPARVHGDLWGGNLHRTADGAPCLIDPAAHGGHREIDLAMMQLFGGFGPRVFAAYDETYPLARGHRERVPLYQLYFLLVHVNLFGQGYLAGVRRCLDHYL